MKIAFLCNSIFTDGGVQRVITTLANLLAEDQKYHITIICTKKQDIYDVDKYNLNHKRIKVEFLQFAKKVNYKELILKGIRFLNKKTGVVNNDHLIKFSKEIYYKSEVRKEAIGFFNEKKFDVVIACEGNLSLLMCLVKKELECKIITWQHNSYDAYFNTKNKYYWNRNVLFKKYLKKSDCNVVLTEHDKLMYKKELNIDSTCIYNPLSFYSEKKSDLKNNNLLAVGRLTKQKGFDILIESFKLVVNELDDIRLTIVGEGEEKNNLIRLVKKLSLQDKVVFMKFSKQIQKIMLDSKIYIMSSRWEGFGLVVTEAMEMGLPIISFNLTGPKEILGNNGLIIERENKKELAKNIEKLLKDENLLKEYSYKSQKRVEKFYGENIKKQWDELLLKL